MTAINLLKKLAPRTILGERPTAPSKDDGDVFLFRVAGTANNWLSGESTYGTWSALTGDFIAERGDGERFGGSKLFLPEPVHGMLINAVQAQLDEGLANASVQFVADVFIRHAETATGYEYMPVPVLEQASNSLALLESSAETKALPSAAAKPAASKKTAAKK